MTTAKLWMTGLFVVFVVAGYHVWTSPSSILSQTPILQVSHRDIFVYPIELTIAELKREKIYVSVRMVTGEFSDKYSSVKVEQGDFKYEMDNVKDGTVVEKLDELIRHHFPSSEYVLNHPLITEKP